MPEYRSSGREPRRDYDDRYARSTPRNAYAPRNGARPQGSRPPQGRRPAPRRRKKRVQPRFFIIAAVLIVLALALVMILGGGSGSGDPKAQPTPVPSNGGMPSNVTGVNAQGENPPTQPQETMNYSTLSEWLGDESSDTSVLANVAQVEVSDLSINPNLPDDWINILLLGTDERTLSESARTDTMIICSIKRSTGEVKLTSILRDVAVEFDDLGEYNGTYRINSANFFGGPEYAMKTVNECFDMNIQHYVTVNFFGFQKIAQALGGIQVDITKAEMDEINNKQLEQYRIAKKIGLATKEDYQLLTTYGANTQLDGNQTLAYARVRAIDSDISRAQRQRTVLVKLMQKLKGKSVTEIAAMAASLSTNVTMNLDLNTVLEIAYTVLSSGMLDIETLRIPAAQTYKEERRGEQAMLYDCDFATNALNLYNFIYE